MSDNDPAATAALAERVAELDRLFPRREETTGRAMCAGWGPSDLMARTAAEQWDEGLMSETMLRDRFADDGWPISRKSIAEPGLCTSVTFTPNGGVHACVFPAGHDGNHRDGPDPHTARGWTDDAPKPPTVRRDVASVTT